MVQTAAFSALSWLSHGFSTRSGGVSTAYSTDPPDLNLGFTADDDPAYVLRNREIFVQAVTGSAATSLVTVRQVHGTTILPVHGPASGFLSHDHRALYEADGLITNLPGVVLGIQAADCVPVLLADQHRRAVAAVHAGWRGTVASIVEIAVLRMQQEYGTRPEDLLAAIGPAIGPCCYTVGEEVQARFQQRFSYSSELFRETPAGLHLDLAHANRLQLINTGLPAENISVVAECTACTRDQHRRKYFSHRDEAGRTGRAMGAIAIKPPVNP